MESITVSYAKDLALSTAVSIEHTNAEKVGRAVNVDTVIETADRLYRWLTAE